MDQDLRIKKNRQQCWQAITILKVLPVEPQINHTQGMFCTPLPEGHNDNT